MTTALMLDLVRADELQAGDLIEVSRYISLGVLDHYAYGIVDEFRPYGGDDPKWSQRGALTFRYLEIDGAVAGPHGELLSTSPTTDMICPIDRLYEVIR